jgi:hypothetical protein
MTTTLSASEIARGLTTDSIIRWAKGLGAGSEEFTDGVYYKLRGSLGEEVRIGFEGDTIRIFALTSKGSLSGSAQLDGAAANLSVVQAVCRDLVVGLV